MTDIRTSLSRSTPLQPGDESWDGHHADRSLLASRSFRPKRIPAKLSDFPRNRLLRSIGNFTTTPAGTDFCRALGKLAFAPYTVDGIPRSVRTRFRMPIPDPSCPPQSDKVWSSEATAPLRLPLDAIQEVRRNSSERGAIWATIPASVMNAVIAAEPTGSTEHSTKFTATLRWTRQITSRISAGFPRHRLCGMNLEVLRAVACTRPHVITSEMNLLVADYDGSRLRLGATFKWSCSDAG